MASPGWMMVMKSDSRLALLRVMLSLYSSATVTLGTIVSGARRGICSRCGSSVREGNTYGGSGICWAATAAGHSDTTPTAATRRSRAITGSRISHVSETRKGLLVRGRVQALDRLMIMRERRRLLDHVNGAHPLDVLDLVRRRVTGDDDYREGGADPAHFRHDVEPVHAGHGDVQKEGVVRAALDPFERLLARVHHRRPVSLTL